MSDDEDRKDDEAEEKAAEAKAAKAKDKAKAKADEAARAAESTDDDEAQRREEEAAEEKAEASESEDGEQDPEAAKRVADALGVGEESDEPAAEAADAEPDLVPNRAMRRRDEAKKRRKKSGAVANPDDEEAPKDRNKRAKDLLSKRREQAAGGPRPVALLPSEMVDDALARTANASVKWLRTNGTIIQWALIAAAVVGGGFLYWQHHTEAKSASASSELFAAVADERGRVMKEDKRPDEEKEVDPTKIFKTPEERSDAALAAYQKVASEHPSGGPAMLAKLGEAGAQLDKRDWPKALELYSAVAASTLAAADPDVKGRAVEGIGFANEGKNDLDNALKAFTELEKVDAKGFKELGLYHQARVQLKKGDKEKAKELFKKVHDALAQPQADGSKLAYLERMNDDQLRQLDPAAVPPKPTFGGPKGNTMTPEEARRYLEKLQDAAQKKGGGH